MAKSLNILIVTKDTAEYQIYSPVAAALRARGHKVTVIAEGLSLGKWLDAGEDVWAKERRDDINPEGVLYALKPDLVLTGLGAPINLGEKFGLAANRLGIKLGYVEDVWGVHTRSGAVPDFTCTLDPFGKALIGSHKLYNGRTVHVHVTGSPAMDRLASIKPDPEVSVATAEHDLTILLAGQDESTTPVIAGLVEVLNKANSCGKRILIIPRFHPKFASLQQEWLNSLAGVPCDVFRVGSHIATDQLMLSANITVSIYSNALIEAATLRSLPVSWVSDVGRASMQANLGGLERFPLVDLGCAVEVSMPGEFMAISQSQREQVLKRCHEVFPNDGGNTERVIHAIEAECA